MRVHPIDPNVPGYDACHVLVDRWVAAWSATSALHALAQSEVGRIGAPESLRAMPSWTKWLCGRRMAID